MKSVFKYVSKIGDVIVFNLPVDAVLLHVNIQDTRGDVCLWAMINPEEEKTEIRKVRIAGTGHNIEQKNISYINTFTVDTPAGKLWFHAFEIK